MKRFTWRFMVVAGCALALTPAGPAVAAGRRPPRADGPGCFQVAATVRVGTAPEAVAVDPRTDLVYIANIGGKATKFRSSVSVISGRRYRVTSTIGTGYGPGAITVNPATGLVYVTESLNANQVTVIDPQAQSVIFRIPLTGDLGGLAVDRLTNLLYVAGPGTNTVRVISGKNNTVVATITVPQIPQAVSLIPKDSTLFAADGGGVRSKHGFVSIINTSTRTVVQTLRVGRQPDAVAADWMTGRAYVVNSGAFTAAQSGSVSVLAPCQA